MEDDTRDDNDEFDKAGKEILIKLGSGENILLFSHENDSKIAYVCKSSKLLGIVHFNLKKLPINHHTFEQNIFPFVPRSGSRHCSVCVRC